jgi:protein TonB
MIVRRALSLLGVAIAAASCGPMPTVQQRSAATNKDVRAYFDKVAAHVNQFRDSSLASLYGEGRVVVMVRVARDGQVLEVQMQQGSGRAPIDDAEVNAFWRASPLPPPPPEFVGNPVTLLMPITYKNAR